MRSEHEILDKIKQLKKEGKSEFANLLEWVLYDGEIITEHSVCLDEDKNLEMGVSF